MKTLKEIQDRAMEETDELLNLLKKIGRPTDNSNDAIKSIVLNYITLTAKVALDAVRGEEVGLEADFSLLGEDHNIYNKALSDQKKKETHTKWLNDLIFPEIEKLFKGEIEEIPDYGNTLYNYLDTKFINFSTDRKEEIKEMARVELLDEFRVDKMAKQHDRNRIGKVITDILMNGKETEGLVRTRAKKIALNTFLAECKEMDREIINEIKEHENLPL